MILQQQRDLHLHNLMRATYRLSLTLQVLCINHAGELSNILTCTRFSMILFQRFLRVKKLL